MQAFRTNLFVRLCQAVAVLAAAIIILSLRAFISYHGFTAEHSTWLGASYNLFATKFSLGAINGDSRLLQICLLLCWCMCGGVTLWSFVLSAGSNLAPSICLLLASCACLISGYYVFISWHSISILFLDLSLITVLCVFSWAGCASNMQSRVPSYRFRVIRPWAVVGFVCVLLQLILSCIAALSHKSTCHFWPYCKAVTIPGAGTMHHLLVKMLLFIARDLTYHFTYAISICYLVVLSVMIIVMRLFGPLRLLGVVLLVCTVIQFNIWLHAPGMMTWLQSILWQVGFLLFELAVLICLMQRVFSGARIKSLRTSASNLR
jgi:hypothetical protein